MRLEIDELTFYSQKDETNFFAWLKSIDAIEFVRGEGLSIIANVLEPVSDPDLRELIAVLYRYGVDMKQLDHLVNDANREWFAVPGMYWYSRVFGGCR